MVSFQSPPEIPNSIVPALGRPLSWDPYGAYGLDSDRPLTPASKRIVKNIINAELGSAESIARYRLRIDKDDLVPAWALAQIIRVRKQAMAEYRKNVAPHVGETSSRPVRLYRFYICHFAFDEFMRHVRSGNSPIYFALSRDMTRLRDQSKNDAASSLGLTIALTNGDPFWVLSNREILRAYRQQNPKTPDVRPLICRAYIDGIETTQKGIDLLDRPAPEKALEIARSILEDRPQDALELYYQGRCHFALGRSSEAVRDIRASLATGRLPPIYEHVAKVFLNHPSADAFFSVPIVG